MTRKHKARNATLIVKDNLEEAAGKATGDSQLEANGNLDQVKGNIKQAGEKVKDALKE
jgi:uncharacterized protein YjbJ (UPF0337 family)